MDFNARAQFIWDRGILYDLNALEEVFLFCFFSAIPCMVHICGIGEGRNWWIQGDNFVLQEHRLFCLHRFIMWWMVPRIGDAASDIPVETQMLLLEAAANSTIHALSDNSPFYILLLPVIDGAFRSSF